MRSVVSLMALTFILYIGCLALVRALPGDPAETLIAESGLNISVPELRHELGLDVPLIRAIPTQLVALLHGDLGQSLAAHMPVSRLFWPRLWRTLLLAFAATVVALAIASTLGVAAAANPGGWANRVSETWAGIASSLPLPWLGPILCYALAVKIPLFPLGGSLWLPALTLGLSLSGHWIRVVRMRVREALSQEAARYARARGLSEVRIALKYGLAPAGGALIGWICAQSGHLIGGAVLTEQLFDWPGVGSLLVDSVLRRDYPVVEICLFVGIVGALWGIQVGEWLQQIWDPRARSGAR